MTVVPREDGRTSRTRGASRHDPRTRLALEAMLGRHSTLRVYLDADGGEDGAATKPWFPRPESGEILHDCVAAPSPMRVSRALVRRLRGLGLGWDDAVGAEVFAEGDRARLRAVLDGRDVLWVGSPAFPTTDASDSADAPGPGDRRRAGSTGREGARWERGRS